MAFHPEELMGQGLLKRKKSVEAATLLLLQQAEGWDGNPHPLQAERPGVVVNLLTSHLAVPLCFLLLH